MEKAIIPLIEKANPSNDAQYYYFKRSPSKAPFYELEDVVKDLSFALEDQERHGQKLPLIVLLDNGSKQQSLYRINIRFDNGEIEFCKKAIEFLEIIKKDPKNEHRKEELDFRIGELEDYFLGDNRLNTTDDKLIEYYDAFLYDLF